MRLLLQYIGERVDKWPIPPRPFKIWLESTLDKRAHQGKKNHFNQLKTICNYCSTPFDYDKTKDHVIPVSKGGLDKKENKRPCCFDCNQWKSDKMPDDWLDELVFLVKHEKKIRPPYDKASVGVMIGRLKRTIAEIKQIKKKVSIYKF